MPSPSLNVTYRKALSDIQILENYRNDSLHLEAKFQQFVAEVILIRLFSIVESTIKECALKIACQANYRNGNAPTPLHTCRSQIDAENQFINYNRTRPARLKWTKASFINESIKKIIPPTEQFRIEINNYGLLINEMRMVRNHVAHRTSSTGRDYKQVVRQTFGAQLKIQPGAFLTSTKRLTNPKINDYIRISRILVNDITNG